ncbi:diguanylate cyclase [Sulfuritalea sp.]|uniref:diguanylate cyclase domain-containing protein n=1 Tax=Sulfuritalea sp. TaxID=2480090 RepID=UPI001AC94C8D|nr:diguanylate cyclase [Sulfuritalea sp.]MBN8474710.1 diguanylate cyclase [Sulfuritalea sp.]
MRAPTKRSSMVGGLSSLWLQPVILFAIVAFCALMSFALNWRQIDANMHAVARERGAALFRLLELTRDWNARHGGVYVPVTPATLPNPHLDHPRRDVVTHEGQPLTMINPAYMTRQIAEIAQLAEGVQLHITSLKPIRPANAADAWEANALRRFEAGLAEVTEFIPGVAPVHRYMAPLKVTEACLKCHSQQGYEVGQIRGGVSIIMPAAELLAIRDADRIRSIAFHLLMFCVAAALLHLLVRRTRGYLLALEHLTLEQEQVIADRTRDLSQANSILERQLEDSETAATVFENAAEAIVVTDEKGNFIQVNPAFSQMSGYPPEEVLGRPVGILKSDRHPADFYAQMWRLLIRDSRWQGEVWNQRKNGEVFIVWLSISCVASSGQPRRYVATLTDITRSKQLEEELRHRAYHDPLTDLPNRALFSDRLRVAISQAQRHGRSFALCFIDLDGFKPVNDRYGHAAGDELLVECSRRLRACMRAADTIARLGGDEFAAILIDVGSRREVEEVATRIVADLARPFALDAGAVSISCSIGIALFPEHGADAEVLQHSADAALYAVKESSRNAFRICPEGGQDVSA